MSLINPNTITAALFAAATGTNALAANPVPFTETFTDGFDGEPFVTDAVGVTFTTNATSDQLDVVLVDDIRSYATVETSGISSNIGTTVTTSVDFELNDPDQFTTRVGFVLFGTSSGIETPDFSEAYVASVRDPSGFFPVDFQLIENISGVGPDSDDFSDPLVNGLNDGVYNLTAVATILASELEVEMTVTQLNNLALTETFTLSVPTVGIPEGDFFGLYVDSEDSTGFTTPEITFDNFAISTVAGPDPIPEPASALLFAAGLGLLSRRRANRRA
ncbi:MAG: PEP-CTERM sorting domain-containing protein [Planctomycetota bacterium]